MKLSRSNKMNAKVFGYYPAVGTNPARIFAEDIETEWQGGKYATALKAAQAFVAQGAVVTCVHVSERIVKLSHIDWSKLAGG